MVGFDTRGLALTPGPSVPQRRAVAAIGAVEDRAAELAESVSADEVVEQLDPNRVWVGRAFAIHAEAAPRCARICAIADNRIVYEEYLVVAAHMDSTPAVTVDGVPDDVVRASIGIPCLDAVSPVAVNQVVGDQGIRVAPSDKNAAGARGAAVAEDPIPLDMNSSVLAATAESEMAGPPAPLITSPRIVMNLNCCS